MNEEQTKVVEDLTDKLRIVLTKATEYVMGELDDNLEWAIDFLLLSIAQGDVVVEDLDLDNAIVLVLISVLTGISNNHIEASRDTYKLISYVKRHELYNMYANYIQTITGEDPATTQMGWNKITQTY